MADDPDIGVAEAVAGDDVRTGVAWIGQKLREVQYTVIEGRAVVEGCIMLGTVEEVEALTAEAKASDLSLESFGTTIIGPRYRWRNKTVPYQIESTLPDPQRVRDAIAHWLAKTELKFVERTTANAAVYPDYLVFRRVTSGCASNVGCQTGRQFVDLADTCRVGNIIHEIGHAVGLWHEHTRNDRDAWVKLDLRTVPARAQPNFTQRVRDGQDQGTYDYSSIMHYPADAFSTDRSTVITPLQPGAERMGQREGLSAGDIAAVKAIYP